VGISSYPDAAPVESLTVPAATRNRLPLWGRWSLFWTLFVGLGAVLGWALMWFVPGGAGLDATLPYMQRLPLADVLFTSLFWPGLFLLIINGATQLAAAGLIWRRHRLAPVATLVCGVILLGWVGVEFAIFSLGDQAFSANPADIVYTVFGLAEATMAVLWLRHQQQRSA